VSGNTTIPLFGLGYNEQIRWYDTEPHILDLDEEFTCWDICYSSNQDRLVFTCDYDGDSRVYYCDNATSNVGTIGSYSYHSFGSASEITGLSYSSDLDSYVLFYNNTPYYSSDGSNWSAGSSTPSITGACKDVRWCSSPVGAFLALF